MNLSYIFLKESTFYKGWKKYEGIEAHCGESKLLGMGGNVKKRARAEKEGGF